MHCFSAGTGINGVSIASHDTHTHSQLQQIISYKDSASGAADPRRIERLTNVKPHPLLRRHVFYAHRDLQEILDCYEKGTPFYLYTGRVISKVAPGSSHARMLLIIPSVLIKWHVGVLSPLTLK